MHLCIKCSWRQLAAFVVRLTHRSNILNVDVAVCFAEHCEGAKEMCHELHSEDRAVHQGSKMLTPENSNTECGSVSLKGRAANMYGQFKDGWLVNVHTRDLLEGIGSESCPEGALGSEWAGSGCGVVKLNRAFQGVIADV